jgi:hypothetical protein
MTLTSKHTFIRRDAGARVRKFIRTALLTALMLPLYGAFALLLIGVVAVHSGVLAVSPIESPDASKPINVALAPGAFGSSVEQPACPDWDRAARAAIAALAGTEIAPAQIMDAKFRLRRARRNCTAGWVNLACGDYQAILGGPRPLGGGKRLTLDVSQACNTIFAETD